jgi:NAD-dependent deacetylase
MKKIVVLTGAGISAESGLKTFRDSGGLWEGYSVYDVASPEAWRKDPVLVQTFYNERRKDVLEAKPNEAHRALARLEEKYDVTIITQNIDDLHERAGSSQIIHLHGLITKSQSDKNPMLTYDISGWELKMGELCELGSQLRPHVVWFGESVPMISVAQEICMKADMFIIIGTSLKVYPAAGLFDFVPTEVPKYLIDTNPPDFLLKNTEVIIKSSTIGVPELVGRFLNV